MFCIWSRSLEHFLGGLCLAQQCMCWWRPSATWEFGVLKLLLPCLRKVFQVLINECFVGIFKYWTELLARKVVYICNLKCFIYSQNKKSAYSPKSGTLGSTSEVSCWIQGTVILEKRMLLEMVLHFCCFMGAIFSKHWERWTQQMCSLALWSVVLLHFRCFWKFPQGQSGFLTKWISSTFLWIC